MRFFIKLSSGEKFSVDDGNPQLTVGDFKKVISSKVGFAAEETLLIFSGHVMKDEQTLASYDVKEDCIMHAVKKSTGRANPPANQTAQPQQRPASVPSAVPKAAGGVAGVGAGGGAAAGAAGGLGALGALGALGGLGGMEGVDFNTLMQNPEFQNEVMQILQNPQAQALLNNPDFIRQLNNPQNLQRFAQRMRQLQQGQGGGAPRRQVISKEDFYHIMDTIVATGRAPTSFPSQQQQAQPQAQAQPQPQPQPQVQQPQPSSIPPPATNPREAFREQLRELVDMGFSDETANLNALIATQGNVEAAVDRLLGGN